MNDVKTIGIQAAIYASNIYLVLDLIKMLFSYLNDEYMVDSMMFAMQLECVKFQL